jgi:hydrogenase maturation protease
MTRAFFWIIGYGNPQRRDDGLGPHIALRLIRLLRGMEGVEVRSPHQLELSLVEDLKEAEAVIFIDATAAALDRGWQWRCLRPWANPWPLDFHEFSPSMLLGMMKACFGRCPSAWMVSIQGDDFEFGEHLSDGALRRSEKVADLIAAFVRSWPHSRPYDALPQPGTPNRPANKGTA